MIISIPAHPGIPQRILDLIDQHGRNWKVIGEAIGEEPASTAPDGVDPKKWAAVLYDFVNNIDVLDPAASNAAVLDWIGAYLPQVAAVFTDAEIKVLAEGIESMV